MADSTDVRDEGAGPLPVDGVRLAVGASGTRYRNRHDLTLVEIGEGGQVACLFTRNKFCAAPVLVARRHLEVVAPRYFVINAGNANAGTGVAGERTALDVCAAVARAGGCATEAVLPFSTGVIGQPLNAPALARVVPDLIPALRGDGWSAAAGAIVTTDTRPKTRSATATAAGVAYTVTGMAKGSGMIKPDMATMLAFVATDATVEPSALRDLAAHAADCSFNRITVDGDTSTNDAFALIATGRSGGAGIDGPSHPHYPALLGAVDLVCRGLAQDIVRDGEGATKFITVRVTGGASERECLKAAYAVAESPLVKTAFFASDANWGRILAAVGRAGVEDLDTGAVSIALEGYAIVRNGEPVPGYDEESAAEIMKRDAVEIAIGIGHGPAAVEIWTCDLSYDYVRINAEYRS